MPKVPSAPMNSLVRSYPADDFLATSQHHMRNTVLLTHLDRCRVLMTSPLGSTIVCAKSVNGLGGNCSDYTPTHCVQEPFALGCAISNGVRPARQCSTGALPYPVSTLYRPHHRLRHPRPYFCPMHLLLILNVDTHLHPVAIIPPIQALGPGSSGKNSASPLSFSSSLIASH